MGFTHFFKKGIFPLSLLLASFLSVTVYSGYQTITLTKERADLMRDFSRVNDIRNGLFSVDTWKTRIKEIVGRQIEDFNLSPGQDSLLRVQVSELLHSLIDEAKNQIQNDDDSFGKRVRNLAVRTFVNWDDLRAKIPAFTDRIMQEITSETSKERLKSIALQKLETYASEIEDHKDSQRVKAIIKSYGAEDQESFNKWAKERAAQLQEKAYQFSGISIGIAALFLLAWLYIGRKPNWQRLYFIFCVLVALSVLVAGLGSPMIEIDARLSKMDFTLMGEHLIFEDQLLYYRSKSILEVVSVLIGTGKADSVLVGGLIFAFSVLLPVAKLLSSQVYLFGTAALRNNKLLSWLAFKSGKWSMADVIVVAIFMAYVGFKGILDNQTRELSYETDTVTSISTNYTGLQPGFFLFLAFVLFSLILSEILARFFKK